MIPKILHRMWLDKKISNNENAPKKYDPFIKSFDDNNPDFITIFWNMDKVKKLFEEYPIISKYQTVWKKLPHHIQKCDFARYLIIYLYGGIYIDLDFMCFRNLSPLLERELLLVLEPSEHSKIYQDPIDARLFNGLIGSVPKHQFWLEWIEFIIQSLKKTSDVMYTTGPINFRLFFNQSKYKNVPLVNTCDLLPIFRSENGKQYITNDCINRNNGSNKINNDYYKTFKNYTHTKWSEGSGWGEEQLQPEDKLGKTVIVSALFKQNNKKNKLCILIFILTVLVIFLIIGTLFISLK